MPVILIRRFRTPVRSVSAPSALAVSINGTGGTVFFSAFTNTTIMDDLTHVNSVIKGDNSRKSYCIVTEDQLVYGLSRQQLENLQRRIKVFREKEKVVRKRAKETHGDFWFSIEMDMNLDETCDNLQTRYHIFSSTGKIQCITYSQIKALSDTLQAFLKDNTRWLRLQHIDNSICVHEEQENFLVKIIEDGLTNERKKLIDDNIDVSKSINHSCWDDKPTFIYINGQCSGRFSPAEFEEFEKNLLFFYTRTNN